MSAALTSVVSPCVGGFYGVGVSPSSPPQAAKKTHIAAAKINFFIVNPVSNTKTGAPFSPPNRPLQQWCRGVEQLRRTITMGQR